MSRKLTKKVAPAAGRSCDIGLANSKRFLAKDDDAFITHRRKQELNHAAYHIYQYDTAIQGDIADLSDLDLIYASAGTAEGPPRSFNATQVNDFSLDICWVGRFGFSPQAKEDLLSRGI